MLTKHYEELRRKGLLDRTKLTAAERAKVGITEDSQGGGNTDPDKLYIFDNIPLALETRSKKKVDRRDYPLYGIGDKKEE